MKLTDIQPQLDAGARATRPAWAAWPVWPPSDFVQMEGGTLTMTRAGAPHPLTQADLDAEDWVVLS